MRKIAQVIITCYFAVRRNANALQYSRALKSRWHDRCDVSSVTQHWISPQNAHRTCRAVPHSFFVHPRVRSSFSTHAASTVLNGTACTYVTSTVGSCGVVKKEPIAPCSIGVKQWFHKRGGAVTGAPHCWPMGSEWHDVAAPWIAIISLCVSEVDEIRPAD